uniref:Uncharacterized protein n=1 Tax=Latimeria chalumnae TaxID=7897 RepID=H2ZSQ8_LATCH
GCKISASNVVTPQIRDFWEKLASCVVPHEEGGHVDLFVPLAASESGMEVLSQLSHVTGLCFRAPAGIITGSYQHILGDWLGNSTDGSPPSIYFNEAKLLTWCRLAETLEEAFTTVRKQTRPYFSELQKNIYGRVFGQFLYDSMSLDKLQTQQEAAQVLAEGLVALSRENSGLRSCFGLFLPNNFQRIILWNFCLHFS